MIHWIDKGTDEEMASFAARDGCKVRNYSDFTKSYEANDRKLYIFADPTNTDHIIWRTTKGDALEMFKKLSTVPANLHEPAVKFETEYTTNGNYSHCNGQRPNYGRTQANINGLTISAGCSMVGATGDLEGAVSGRPNYGNEKIVGSENLKAAFTIKPDGRINIGRVSDGDDERGWGLPPWARRGIYMSDVGPLVSVGHQQPQQRPVIAEQRVGELLARVYEPLMAAVDAMRHQLHAWNQERLAAEKVETEKREAERKLAAEKAEAEKAERLKNDETLLIDFIGGEHVNWYAGKIRGLTSEEQIALRSDVQALISNRKPAAAPKAKKRGGSISG